MGVDPIFELTDAPGSIEVLGVRLLPLSVWHSWQLCALESPFAIGGNGVDASDVAVAITVLSRTRAQCQELASDNHAMQIAIHSIALEGAEEVLACVPAIEQHIKAFSKWPEFWEKGDKKGRLRCPAEWHLALMLVKLGVCKTEEDAWNYPVSRARCWLAVEAEKNGDDTYIDLKDRLDIEGLKNG